VPDEPWPTLRRAVLEIQEFEIEGAERIADGLERNAAVLARAAECGFGN
jgi:hypothetical protein